MIASHIYVVTSRPVRSPANDHTGIDRQHHMVVQTATSGP
jgi:hypothetical protein